LLFVRDATHVKSIEVERDIDREPLDFGTVKHVASLVIRAFGSKPLTSIRDASIVGRSLIEHWYAQKYSSFCEVLVFAL
jgi:hypothetical protein